MVFRIDEKEKRHPKTDIVIHSWPWSGQQKSLVKIQSAQVVNIRSAATTLRPQIQALGSDISELPNSRSVIYRVFDFVVEVLPRSNRLGLLLNLEFSEADDTSGKAEDATQSAFIVNATEKGGVYFLLATAEEIPAAMHLVRQAYELANE